MDHSQRLNFSHLTTIMLIINIGIIVYLRAKPGQFILTKVRKKQELFIVALLKLTKLVEQLIMHNIIANLIQAILFLIVLIT